MKLFVLVYFFVLILMTPQITVSAGAMFNVHQNINADNATIVSTQSSLQKNVLFFGSKKEGQKKGVGIIKNEGAYVNGIYQNINMKNSKVVMTK